MDKGLPQSTSTAILVGGYFDDFHHMQVLTASEETAIDSNSHSSSRVGVLDYVLRGVFSVDDLFNWFLFVMRENS